MRRRASKQRSTRLLLLAAMAAGSGVASAGPPPLPDDFLEYLGSWETDDGDWLIANADTVATTPTASRTGGPTSDAARPGNQSTTAPRGTTAAPAPGTERKP
jgi:hypothetical protein